MTTDDDVKALLDLVESMARQSCHTAGPDSREPLMTDSGAISAWADALQTLHAHGRFRIVREGGRMVLGYWPENDPVQRKEGTA